jgi:hypothetical protein
MALFSNAVRDIQAGLNSAISKSSSSSGSGKSTGGKFPRSERTVDANTQDSEIYPTLEASQSPATKGPGERSFAENMMMLNSPPGAIVSDVAEIEGTNPYKALDVTGQAADEVDDLANRVNSQYSPAASAAALSQYSSDPYKVWEEMYGSYFGNGFADFQENGSVEDWRAWVNDPRIAPYYQSLGIVGNDDAFNQWYWDNENYGLADGLNPDKPRTAQQMYGTDARMIRDIADYLAAGNAAYEVPYVSDYAGATSPDAMAEAILGTYFNELAQANPQAGNATNAKGVIEDRRNQQRGIRNANAITPEELEFLLANSGLQVQPRQDGAMAGALRGGAQGLFGPAPYAQLDPFEENSESMAQYGLPMDITPSLIDYLYGGYTVGKRPNSTSAEESSE